MSSTTTSSKMSLQRSWHRYPRLRLNLHALTIERYSYCCYYFPMYKSMKKNIYTSDSLGYATISKVHRTSPQKCGLCNLLACKTLSALGCKGTWSLKPLHFLHVIKKPTCFRNKARIAHSTWSHSLFNNPNLLQPTKNEWTGLCSSTPRTGFGCPMPRCRREPNGGMDTPWLGWLGSLWSTQTGHLHLAENAGLILLWRIWCTPQHSGCQNHWFFVAFCGHGTAAQLRRFWRWEVHGLERNFMPMVRPFYSWPQGRNAARFQIADGWSQSRGFGLRLPKKSTNCVWGDFLSRNLTPVSRWDLEIQPICSVESSTFDTNDLWFCLQISGWYLHRPGHFPNASVAALHRAMTVFESKVLPNMSLGFTNVCDWDDSCYLFMGHWLFCKKLLKRNKLGSPIEAFARLISCSSSNR